MKNQLKTVTNDSGNKESLKKLEFLDTIRQDARKTLAKLSNRKIYDFNSFRRLQNLTRDIYYGSIQWSKQEVDSMKWKV